MSEPTPATPGRDGALPAEVVEAVSAWARQHGYRDIWSCAATPLAAFEAGMATERSRILVSDETLHADGSTGPATVPDGFSTDPAYWYRRWLFAMKQLDEEAAERISGYQGMRERLDSVVATTARQAERERCAQFAEQEAASADLQVASEEARLVGAVLRNLAARLRQEGSTT